MDIYFATQNKSKINEVLSVLTPKGYNLKTLDIEIDEPSTGTVEEAALLKLNNAIPFAPDKIVITDDAGIYFDAYDNFPGVLTKRIFQMIGYKGLYKLLDGESKQVVFKCAIAVHYNGKQKAFLGTTEGSIKIDLANLDKYDNFFPFDKIFVPKGIDKIYDQLDSVTKQNYSYRTKALEQMIAWLGDGANTGFN